MERFSLFELLVNSQQRADRLPPPPNPKSAGSRFDSEGAHPVSLRSTGLRPVVLRQVAPHLGLANMLESTRLTSLRSRMHQMSASPAFAQNKSIRYRRGMHVD